LLLLLTTTSPAWSQSAALHPANPPASATELALGDVSGRFAAPGYFRGAPVPLDFSYYDAREGRTEALGTTVGDFLVLPRVDVGEAYNDNTFAKSSHAKGDATTVIAPSIGATSLWGAHSAGIAAAFQHGFYSRFSSEDYTDGRVLAEGRYDVDGDNSLAAGTLVQHGHEQRGSPDDAKGSEPTIFDVFQARTAYTGHVGRASAELELRFDDYRYQAVPSPNGPIDTSILDRTAFMPRLRLGYSVVPQTTQVFAQTRFRDTMYARLVNGLDRDSHNYQSIAGIELTPGGPLSGQVFGGITQQEFVSSRIQSFTAPAYGASVTWTPTLLTTIRAEAGYTIEDAAFNGTSGYRQTAFDIALDHELLRTTLLNASIFRAERSYIGQGRHDVYTQLNIGARYAITNSMSAGPSVSVAQRDANFSDTNFSQVVALVRFSAKL
jgi:hypothetical protein